MKNNRTNLAHKSSILMITTVLLASCGGGDGGGGSGDSSSKSSDPKVAAKAFGSQVLFKGGTTVNKKPPVPTATVNNSTVSGGTVKPGDNKTMNLDLSKVVTGLAPTNNITINIAFNNRGGGVDDVSRYTAINTTVGNLSNGIFRTDFQVPSQVCDNLADIQHQIDCYESVTLPDGQVISLSQGRQMLLACGNGSRQSDNSQNNSPKAGDVCFYNYPKASCDGLKNGSFNVGGENYTDATLQQGSQQLNDIANIYYLSGTGSGSCDNYGNVTQKLDFLSSSGMSTSEASDVGIELGTCIIKYK